MMGGATTLINRRRYFSPWSAAATHAFAQQPRKRRCIAAHVAQLRCIIHLLNRGRPPVDVVPGLQPQLPNELALRPAIAFAKRMSGIQLTEEPGGPPGKQCGIEIDEVVLGREFVHGLQQRRFQESGESEEMAAFGYV